MKIKIHYEIEKSLYPNDKGDYILFCYTETKKGSCIRKIFKGSRKECFLKRQEILYKKRRSLCDLEND